MTEYEIFELKQYLREHLSLNVKTEEANSGQWPFHRDEVEVVA